jgi:hypothetical protein
MRITLLCSRSRALMFVAALTALAILPTSALAASKNVKFRFSSTSYSVTESAGTFTATVVRTGNTRDAASVDYATADGTAHAGTNYVQTHGTLNFAAGQTTKTFAVSIIDNQDVGPANRKLTLALSNGPDPIPPGRAEASLTILDDDGPGTIDLSSATYDVVEGAGVATITVTRASASNLIESVEYSTSAPAPGTGHATAGTDYTTTAGTLTFGMGETSKTFQVPILDDQDFEGDETLNVTLSNPQNISSPLQRPVLGTHIPATLTIEDDDVSTFSFSQPTYLVNEGGGTASITVTRTGATNVEANVGYSVDPAAPGTATGGGTDYALAAGTLHFAAGETSKAFTVAINDDSTVDEGNETVGLRLTVGGSTVATALLSIVDNDSSLPSVQFSNVAYSVNEAATSVTVTATLSRAAAGPVTVHYDTDDVTATGGADYTDTGDKTLTFVAGQVSKSFDIALTPDADIEDDETFTVTLFNPTGAQLGAPKKATVTIVDDDGTGTLDFTAQRYDVDEAGGHATVTVRRVGGSGGTASVDYATSDGTARAPGDYTPASGTLNFADGETQKTFDIPVAWDGLAESNETVSIELTNFVSDDDPDRTAAAVLHIADSGASGPAQFDAGSYSVAENGGPATITVTRSGNLGGPVTVDYATSDGTAHAGTDYSATHGTLTFAAGEMAKTFPVAVTDDNIHQGALSVNLTLSNPGGGTSVGAQGTAALTITDNEPVSSASTDRTAPKLTITAKKLQNVLELQRFALKVRSNEAARLSVALASGKQVTVAKTSKRVAANVTVTITVRLDKKAIAKLRKALVNGKATLRVTVTGTDVAGNRATVRRTITVR